MRPRAAAAPPSAGEPGSLRQRLVLRDDEALDRGAAVHALFEAVGWLEDGVPEKPRLLDLVRRTAPRRDERWRREVVALFRGAIAAPEIRHLLSRRERDPAALALMRERPFVRIAPGGDEPGRIQQGVIDRLEIELGDDGRPRSALVIDFKTDAVEELWLAGHAESYRGQLETYRSAAARMLALPETAVSMTLAFIRPARAVRLEERE